MASEAKYVQDGHNLDYTPAADVAAGEVLQLADGRAAFAADAIASGVVGAVRVCGVVKVPKTTGIVVLDGGKVYWDHSANKAHFKPANDRDFYLGTAVGDAASADTTLKVALNVQPVYVVDANRDGCRTVVVKTAGTPGLDRIGGSQVLRFSATNEAQKVDLLSKDGVAPGANAIVEVRLEVANQGDNAALDFNVGLASATHATDADSIAESLFVHLDGNTLDLKAESDDGTTEVAATDTTVDAVAGTPLEIWFDLRDPADIQIYIDGVNVLPNSTFRLDAATGPLKLLAHLEKTADDTPGEFHVDFLRARIAQQ